MKWRPFSRVLAVGVLLVASGRPTARSADFTYLLYCPSISSCFFAFFYAEEVSVVAPMGRLDVHYSGGWGAREGCPECELAWPQHPAPAPEPVDEGGGGEYSCTPEERNNLRLEYLSGPMLDHYVPGCDEIASSGGTASFSWSELNRSPGSGHPPFGIVKIWVQLEHTKNEYQDQPIYVSSGYRCPHGNYAVGSTAPTSRHLWGDAVDMRRDQVAGAWTEAEFNLLKEAAIRAGFTFFLNWNSYPDHHLHADAR